MIADCNASFFSLEGFTTDVKLRGSKTLIQNCVTGRVNPVDLPQNKIKCFISECVQIRHKEPAPQFNSPEVFP